MWDGAREYWLHQFGMVCVRLAKGSAYLVTTSTLKKLTVEDYEWFIVSCALRKVK